MACCTPAWPATAAWVVAPFTVTLSAATAMPTSSGTLVRSTRLSGWFSRCFSVGISVCPPDTGCAPSAASAAMASARLAGFTY